jgi:hypothetical protein
MNNGIYQFPHDGTHIDLSKIISIGPTFISVNEGWGVTAGFYITFQLVDRPKLYGWQAQVPANAKAGETTWGDMPYLQSGENAIDLWRPILEPRIETVRDRLIVAWGSYRDWVTRNSIMRSEI